MFLWYNNIEVSAVELIRITAKNLEREHICCAIAGSKDVSVRSKKAWLSQMFEDGLVFLKGNVRGKCFIEYLPAESAWMPVEAPGYMFIDCLWVSGRYKGHGYSNLLLEECIRDSRAKGKSGLCVVAATPKKPFLSDPKYLAYQGFQRADTAEPYFELWYLPFAEQSTIPRFCPQVKHPQIDEDGFVLYYTRQCPFTAKYVPLLAQRAEELGAPFQSFLLDSREAARSAPTAVTNFALFYNGHFVTHEILSVKKFEALVEAQREEAFP